VPLTARPPPPRIARPRRLGETCTLADIIGATFETDRRAFLAGIAIALLAAPGVAAAQQTERVYRIGLLDYSAPDPGRQAW
jgi:hypothetical protein